MKQLLKKLYYSIFIIRFRGKRNNCLNYEKCKIKQLKINITGIHNKINIDKGTKISNTIFEINGSNNSISIAKHCRVNELHVKIFANNCILQIGNNCTFESKIKISFAEDCRSVLIGNDCMFANDIEIRTSDSHKIYHQNKLINSAEDVVIRNHIWVGNRVSILKGSTISDNSVIGLGSIVTGNVDSNSIYAGIPAKLIFKDIEWKR